MQFIWDNYYYEDEKINEYDLSLFIETDKTVGFIANMKRRIIRERIRWRR